MQKVTVKDIKVKEGMKGDRPWKLIIITGDDGSEFTTFDPGAMEVGVGGVIELEPVIKAGKTNFTEFKILQKGSPSSVSKTNGDQSGMTPEMWAEKDRLERWSIETQVAFKGIVELAKCEHNISPKYPEILNAALDWALAHLKPTTEAAKPATKSDTTQAAKQEDIPDLKTMVFADAGKFKTACVDYIKLNLAQIDKETAGYDLTTEEGRKDAWQSIISSYEKKPD